MRSAKRGREEILCREREREREKQREREREREREIERERERVEGSLRSSSSSLAERSVRPSTAVDQIRALYHPQENHRDTGRETDGHKMKYGQSERNRGRESQTNSRVTGEKRGRTPGATTLCRCRSIGGADQ